MARNIRTPKTSDSHPTMNEKSKLLEDARKEVVDKTSMAEKTTKKNAKVKKSRLTSDLVLRCSQRISGYERDITSLHIPKVLTEQIEENMAGDKTAIYTALIAFGYHHIINEYKKKGEIIKLDVYEVLEEFK